MPAAALRAVLAKRVADGAGSLFAAWRDAAAFAGASGADDFLCQLGRSVAAALEALPVNAEAARAQLRSARAALHSAVDSRCDELEERVTAAETTKIAALERELCALDAALERLRAERGAVAEAAPSLGDAELVERYTELAARLDAAEAQLLTLPSGIVEPPHLVLVADEYALLAGIAAFGRVVAPRPVTAADLVVEGAPPSIRPERILQLHLSLQASHASQSAEELEVSLGAAAAALHVTVSLDTSNQAPQPLQTSVCADIPRRCITITVVVPLSAPAASSIVFHSLSVFGQAVAAVVSIPVRRGMQGGLQLRWISDGAIESMAISLAGQLFITQVQSTDIHVCSPDGVTEPGIPVAATGLSMQTCRVAMACGASPEMYLADFLDTGGLVAYNPTTRTVLWSLMPGSVRGCGAVVALPNAVLVVSTHDKAIYALRPSDGTNLGGGLFVEGLVGYAAADPTTGTVFVNSVIQGRCAVVRLTWNPGSRFNNRGVVAAAGERNSEHPLAVAPPAPGKSASHLVVGTVGESELRVLSLPGLDLVHKHVLRGMSVTALAFDPSGGALAVSDFASKSIHVLAWPLPGMPKLK